MINEKPLSTEQRNALDDKEFGIPELRAYPLNDVSHVEQAVRMFNHVVPEYEKELADNLNKAIKKFGLHINVGNGNRFKKYVKESNGMRKVVEAFIDEERFPLKGKADSYWGTVRLVPKKDCKGISKSLYKYIRNVRVDPKFIDPKSPKDFEVGSGKLTVTFEVPYIEIEYTTISDKFLELELDKLGWKATGWWDGYD